MKRSIAFLLGFVMIAVAQITHAQGKLSMELRTGVDFATQELGEADLSTGFGFEVTVDYRLLQHVSVYGGWGWHRFTTEDSFGGGDFDVEETGYTFGLQFIHPLGTSATEYFIRAGGIYNHIELENSDGDITADSDHGLGWQIGTGLAFSLGENWRLMPGVRYRSLSRDIEVGDATSDADLTYVEIGVGFVRRF